MSTAAIRDPRPVAWRLVIGLLAVAWLLSVWLLGVTPGGGSVLGPIAAGGLALLVAGIVWAVIASPWIPAAVAVATGLAWLSPTLGIQVPSALAEGLLAPSLWPMDIVLVLALVVIVRGDDRRLVDRAVGVLFLAALVVAVATVLTWDPFYSASCVLCRHADPIIDTGLHGQAAVRVAGNAVALAAGTTLMLVSAGTIPRGGLSVGTLSLAVGGITLGGSAVLVAVGDSVRAVWFHDIQLQVGITLTDVATQGLAIGAVGLAMGMIVVAGRRGLMRRRLRLLAAAVAQAPEMGDVGEALAATLGDPGIRVAYVVGDDERLVDVDGEPCAIGPDERRTTLERAGRPVAAIIHGPGSDVSSLPGELGIGMLVALDNERMRAARLAQVRELQASRQRIVAVADAERRRIERDLHDGAQQRLLAIAMDIRLARIEADRAAQGDRAHRLEDAERRSLNIIEELRRIARGVYPAILGQGGLAPALRSLADESRGPLELDIELDGRLPDPIEAAVYAVVSELSAHVAHDPDPHLEVRISREDAQLLLDIRSSAPASSSLLERLRDRIGAAGGELTVDARPDRGTRLHVELPCA